MSKIQTSVEGEDTLLITKNGGPTIKVIYGNVVDISVQGRKHRYTKEGDYVGEVTDDIIPGAQIYPEDYRDSGDVNYPEI